MWPPIERYLPAKRAILSLLIVVSQLIQFGQLDGLGVDWPPMLRETTFTPILLGVLLAHVLDSPRGYRAARALLGHRLSGLALLSVAAMCLQLMPVDLRGWPRPLLHLLMMGLLCACVVREDHALSRLLGSAPIVRMGVLSYGMYLWHVFVVHFVMEARPGLIPSQLQFPLTLAGTVAVAEVSYRYYEQRFLDLKQRFSVH